jgi:hypothetical protein
MTEKLYDDIVLSDDGTIGEPPWGDRRIHQLVPAQPGWWVVARDSGGASYCTPVACWALVQFTWGARIVCPMGDAEGGDIDLIDDGTNHVVIFDPSMFATETYLAENRGDGLGATLDRWRKVERDELIAKGRR